MFSHWSVVGTRLENWSRVNREIYARFCEEAQGEIPGPLTNPEVIPKQGYVRVAHHSEITGCWVPITRSP